MSILGIEQLNNYNHYQSSQFSKSKKEDSEYKSLPKLPPKEGMAKKVLKQIAKLVFLPLSPIVNIAQLIFLMFSSSTQMNNCLKEKDLKPLVKERLNETEQKIQAIAKKAGLSCAHKIKLNVTSELGKSPAASGVTFGQPKMQVPPEYLLKPEDLPAHLKLSKLDKNEIGEDEWVEEFEKWIHKDFLLTPAKKPKSQLNADMRRSWVKVWLKLFRDQGTYQKTLDFIFGHELGHVANWDGLKHCLIDLSWKVLSIITGGPLVFLADKIHNLASRRFEKEADLFSAKVTGNAASGAKFFVYFKDELKKIRTKYPEIADKIDANGDYKNSDHPTNSERISYLMTAAAAA